MARFLIAGIAGVLGACAQHPAHVVSTYGSSFGCCGQYEAWLVPHSGVDFSGEFGEDVIAPADGMVINHVGANPATCGNTIAIHHAEFRRYTVYCHFQDVTVQPGQPIKRGDKIGTLGDSGVAGGCRRIGRPCAIVHMELTTVPHGHPRAVEGETFDMLQYSAGCFEPGASHPADRLVLTYPVRCKNPPR